MFLHVVYNYSNYPLNNLLIFIIIFSAYVFFVIVPMTLYNNPNPRVLVGLKNHYAPFIIALFLQIKLNSECKLIRFLKIITYCGIIASLYSILQVSSLIFKIFPIINQISINYISSTYTQSSIFSLEIFKVSGLLFNATQNGFFTGCCFFIVLLIGNQFIRKQLTIKLILLVLYIGVIITLSRQILMSLHLILLFILFIKSTKYNFPSKLFLKKGKYFILFLFSAMLILSILFYYTEYYQYAFSISNSNETTTKSILLESISNLPRTITHHIIKFPIKSLLGFGFFNGATDKVIANQLTGVTGELHFLFESLLKFGIIGFAIYWSFIFYSGFICWKNYKAGFVDPKNNPNLFLLGMTIIVFMMLQLIHYSPLGNSNNILFALAIYISSNKLIRRTQYNPYNKLLID